MSFKVEHHCRYDAAGKVDADDWVVIPRAELRPNLQLESALADEMAKCYFDIVQKSSGWMRVVRDAQGVRYLAPLGKTVMVFTDPERIADAQRVETSWRIAGGFMLAHRANYGGRFYIGAEWEASGALKLYSSIRRYPPRLTNWFGVARGIQVYKRTQAIIHQQTEAKFLNEMTARVTQQAVPKSP